jgi:hypothetical protein
VSEQLKSYTQQKNLQVKQACEQVWIIAQQRNLQAIRTIAAL